MSRRFPLSTKKDMAPEARSQSAGSLKQRRWPRSTLCHRPNRKLLFMERFKTTSQKSEDDRLTAALLAQDEELTRILQGVDQIAKNMKSNASTQTLREALHRAVLSALRRSILDKDLRSLALTDDLTHIYNRRAFYALATQQLKVVRRNGHGLLLFFADVDHLKNINDSFGHREGDLALVRTADALERTFRDSDILARISGDEFAVLALDAAYQDRGAILRRLEENIRKVSAEETRYRLSVSVGMARFEPKHGTSLEQLLAKADHAMYEEKKTHPKFGMSQG